MKNAHDVLVPVLWLLKNEEHDNPNQRFFFPLLALVQTITIQHYALKFIPFSFFRHTWNNDDNSVRYNSFFLAMCFVSVYPFVLLPLLSAMVLSTFFIQPSFFFFVLFVHHSMHYPRRNPH